MGAKPKGKHRRRGFQAERMACQWLQQQGLVFIDHNWQCRLGEIDLIMRHNDSIVFVEVKYRRSRQYGGALAAVTYRKQRKLMAAAGIWLSRQRRRHDVACRFDVLGMEPAANGGVQYQWIQNAFWGE